MAFLTQVFSILTLPSGSALYHILTLFALEAAFAIALGHWWRWRSEAHVGRLAAAAFLAGAGRGLLFVLGALGLSGLIPMAAILPPLDRAMGLATLVLLAWSLTFRKGKIWADALLVLALIGVIVGYIAAAIIWYPFGTNGIPYNPYDTGWGLAKLAVILFTLFALLLARPADWVFAGFSFLTLGAGVGLHLINPLPTENFPAPERMAELIALPLFAVILYRHALGVPPLILPVAPSVPVPASEAAIPAPAAEAAPKLSAKTLTPQAAVALAAVALADHENIIQRVTEAVGKTMLADTTLIFAPPEDDGNITCIGGYDLIREHNILGFTLSAKKINTVTSAIQRGRPLRLRLAGHRSELLAIADALGVSPFESAAMIPLRTTEKNFGGIMIVAPHSQKEWSNEDHALLASLATPLANALVHTSQSFTNAQAQEQLTAAQERTQQLATELEAAHDELRQLTLKAEGLAAIIQAQPTNSQNEVVEALTAQLAQAQTEIQTLNKLRDELAEHEAEAVTFKEQLEALNKELDRSHTEVRKANEAQTTITAAIDGAHQKEIQRLHDDIAALHQQLANAQRDLQNASEAQATALATTNTAHREELQRLTKEIASLTERLDNAQTKVQQLTTAPRAAGEPVSSDDLSRLRKEVSSLSQQLTGAEIEIESLREENKQLSEIRSSALYSSLASQSSEIAARVQDLRQPLSSVVGYTDMLLSESVGILGALQKSLLDRIKVGTERMTVALDDLSRAAALSTGNLKSERDTTTMSEVFTAVYSELEPQFKQKEINVHLSIPSDLPNARVDRDAVHQIVSRLLVNACLVSQPRSEVTLTARSQNNEYILISVHDAGQSLKPEEQEQVFTRIYRDSGAGLSVAKALTEANGGRLWIDPNTGGNGNTFSVLLPTNHANVA